MLIRKFDLPGDHITWYDSVTGWLSFDDLPTAVELNPEFGAWDRLRLGVSLRDSFEGTENVHELLANAADEATALDLLSERTGWSRDDLQVLVDNLQYSVPASFADEIVLANLRDAMSIIRRIGTSAENLWAWTRAANLTSAEAAELKGIVKAKYGDTAWPKIATPLRDALREQQRDACVSYLIADNANFKTPDDVFAEYLIDVEMSSCALTSRIKQAIGSVQMYIQRVLLNLESPKKLDDQATRWWKWMKHYRVWEANRKVFLYPENWIEPELRDDKTEIFTSVEGHLLRGEHSEQHLTAGVAKYLEGLEEVAHPEIVSICSHDGREHVIARTRDLPHRYFYRKLDVGNWLPWESVPLPIEGDNVVPVVHRDRLYLFWLKVETEDMGEEELEENPQPPPDQDGLGHVVALDRWSMGAGAKL